jgi:hypothetical protein
VFVTVDAVRATRVCVRTASRAIRRGNGLPYSADSDVEGVGCVVVIGGMCRENVGRLVVRAAASSVVERARARGSTAYALILHGGARVERALGGLRRVVERGVDLTELDERGSRGGSSMW